MDISNHINRLSSAKSALKTSIEGKGVTVPSDATIDHYPALVNQIEQGGNVSDKLSYRLIFHGGRHYGGSNDYPIKVPQMRHETLLIKGYAYDHTVEPHRYYHFSVLVYDYAIDIETAFLGLPALSGRYPSLLRLSVNKVGSNDEFDSIMFFCGDNFSDVSICITEIYIAPNIKIEPNHNQFDGTKSVLNARLKKRSVAVHTPSTQAQQEIELPYRLLFHGRKMLEGNYPGIGVPPMYREPLLIRGYSCLATKEQCPSQYYYFSVLVSPDNYCDGEFKEFVHLPYDTTYPTALQICTDYISTDTGDHEYEEGFETFMFHLDGGNIVGFNKGVLVVITDIYIAPDIKLGTFWSDSDAI